jgi:hypothetical protein
MGKIGRENDILLGNSERKIPLWRLDADGRIILIYMMRL